MPKSAPSHDEFELSLFGPGIGECAVLHLGEDDWVVVDSCLSRKSKQPIALEYLREIGVDPSRQVKLFVISHWHDDHIQGASDLLRECSAARFACSAALKCTEFLKLVQSNSHIKLVDHNSGVSEFAEILNILGSRDPSRFRVGPDHWLTEGLSLLSPEKVGVQLTALSPSSQTVTDATLGLSELMPRVGAAIGRIVTPNPNALSVVLHVKLAGSGILLGADLENNSDCLKGWSAVISSELRSREKSHVYKVAHHGSDNADHPEIWSELVHLENFALITPYARGPRPLPSERDVARVKSRSNNAYSTCWPLPKKPARRKGVDQTMNEILLKRVPLPPAVGHIRVRMKMGVSSPTSPSLIGVDLFDGAARL